MAPTRPARSGGGRLAWLAVAAGVLALLALGVGLWRQRHQRQQLEQARHQQPLPRRSRTSALLAPSANSWL